MALQAAQSVGEWLPRRQNTSTRQAPSRGSRLPSQSRMETCRARRCSLRQLRASLKDPPVVEVVCGFFFSPNAEIDPILVGKYWAEEKQKNGFPRKQLLPAATDQPSIFVGAGLVPVRTWLVSESDEYVIQIQSDRLYFNWRRRQEAYPHFRDSDGMRGVLSRALEELDQFSSFMKRNSEAGLSPTRVDVAKIDQLTSPKHWKSYADLQRIMPMLERMPDFGGEPVVNLGLTGVREGFEIWTTLRNAVLAPDFSQAVQLDTRAQGSLAHDDDVRGVLEHMNEVVNSIFFTCIPDAEKIFGGTKP